MDSMTQEQFERWISSKLRSSGKVSRSVAEEAAKVLMLPLWELINRERSAASGDAMRALGGMRAGEGRG